MSEENEILMIEKWCYDNNCFIYAHPVSAYEVIIRIDFKNKRIDGTRRYKNRVKNLKKDELNWSNEIRKLQKEYFLRHNSPTPS